MGKTPHLSMKLHLKPVSLLIWSCVMNKVHKQVPHAHLAHFLCHFWWEKHSRIFHKHLSGERTGSVCESDTAAAWPCAGQKFTLVIKVQTPSHVLQRWGSDHSARLCAHLQSDLLWHWVSIHCLRDHVDITRVYKPRWSTFLISSTEAVCLFIHFSDDNMCFYKPCIKNL